MKPLTPLEEAVLRELNISLEQYEQDSNEAYENSQTKRSINGLQEESIVNMIGLTQVYEEKELQNAQREQETVDSMLALTDLYEIIMIQQLKIDELETKLNGGTV